MTFSDIFIDVCNFFVFSIEFNFANGKFVEMTFKKFLSIMHILLQCMYILLYVCVYE